MPKTIEYLQELEDTKSRFPKSSVPDVDADLKAAHKFLCGLDKEIKRLKAFLSKK